MARLLINVHCPSANTRRLRDALVAGASHPDLGGVVVRVVEPLAATAEDVFWADGVILGTPANFGYMSGAMKDFFDRTYDACLERTAGLPFALAIRARNDATGALNSMERIITGLQWRQAQDPLLSVGPFDEEFLAAWRDLAMAMAAGMEAGIF